MLALVTAGVADETIKFTNGADLDEVVLPNFERGYSQAMSHATSLGYGNANWGDEEFVHLAKVSGAQSLQLLAPALLERAKAAS